MRTSRTNRHKACHQVSLFRFAVSLKVVLYGTVLETIGSPVRHGHHGEIRIANTGPIDWTTENESIWAILICVYSCCRMPLNLVANVSNCFGCDGIKRVMTNALIANTGTYSKFDLGNRLVTALKQK